MSLRARLALFIGVSVALALLLQGTAGYFSFRQQAFRGLDSDLQTFLTRAERELRRPGRPDIREGAVLEPLPSDFIARVRVIYQGEVVAAQEGFPEGVGLALGKRPQTVGAWRVASRELSGPFSATLQAAVSSREVRRLLGRYRRSLFITAFLVSLLGALSALSLSRPALRPLQYLTATARQVAASGNLSLRVPMAGAGELGELSATFNAMLERLSAFREREAMFTRSASHELRTPLAAMKLQLSSQREGYAEVGETLAALEREVERMTQLSEALLTLAREGRAERVSLDLAALAFEAAEEAGALYEGLEQLEYSGDPLLLRQALANLLDNAAKYAPGAAVTVALELRRGELRPGELRPDADEPFITLSVSDTGPGLSEQERGRASEAFYRASRTSVQGSGLGLAVASQVAQVHGGQLELSANQPTGLKAVLWLRQQEQTLDAT